MNPVTPEQAVSLVEAVTPLLTGPTAGLVTVLIVVLIFAGFTAKYVLPAFLEHVRSQRELSAAYVSSIQEVRSTLQEIQAAFAALSATIHADLKEVRDDLDEQSKDINALRRDVAKLSKAPAGDKS